MPPQVVITGAGIVSALGFGQRATRESLRAHRSGLAPLRYLASTHKTFPVGEVKASDDELRDRLGLTDGRPATRTALLGMVAAREALAEARLTADDIAHAAFISGTTVGGMDKCEQYYQDFLNAGKHAEYIALHDCGATTEAIADDAGRFAIVTTPSTACSSAANAIALGAEMIAAGVVERVVAGGSECLSRFHLNGFNSLLILDSAPCRPFDATRAGLNLGEGAAYVVLESREAARRRGATTMAVVEGWGNACDAFHPTATSDEGEGAYRAMRVALERAGLKPEAIDYVNAHGTGTPDNDRSELRALRRLFGDILPPVSSTKGFTGHTTSASGAIETVICLLALREQFIPVNINWVTPMAEGFVPALDETPRRPLRHVICNAFGFGGNDTSLVLGSEEPRVAGARHTAPAALGVGTSDARPTTLTPQLLSERPPRIFIAAAAQISAQTPMAEEWMENPRPIVAPIAAVVDPDFKTYLVAGEARRMSPSLKRCVAVSKAALRQGGLESPEAIVTGTGLGSVESTEAFLQDLCTHGEQLLKPTHFMQSVHNTYASTVGIALRAHGYNATYSHKGISFESALADAVLQMRARRVATALVGGHDGITASYHTMLHRIGVLGQGGMVAASAAHAALLLRAAETSTGAEAAAPDGALCELVAVRILYRPTAPEVREAVAAMLTGAAMTRAEIDAVLTGANGDTAGDAWYGDVFPDLPLLRYKPLFGESYTSCGLGLYAAAHILRRNVIPAAMRWSPMAAHLPLRNLLLAHAYEAGRHVSLILLRTLCGR